MSRRLARWLPPSVAIVFATALLAPITALGQQVADPATPLPSSAASPALPARAAGMVSVPFAVAPVSPTDRKIVVLADKHHCGLSREDAPRAVVVHLESAEAVEVRVDVRFGNDGRPCPSEKLERIKLELDTELGDRTIVDATRGAPAYLNLVDPIDTGLEYNCNFGAGSGAPIATWLGPGLDVSEMGVRSTIEDARAILNSGETITFVGPLNDKRRIGEEVWWLGGDTWERAGWGSCLPMAVRTPGIDAATWSPRGRLPGPRDRSIRIWVDEWACASGQPPIGRVTRPIIQVRKDSIVIIMGTQPVSAFPRGRSGSRSEDGFAFVDCQGASPAPYTVKLPVKLGKRTLYDGGVYPPKEYPRRSR